MSLLQWQNRAALGHRSLSGIVHISLTSLSQVYIYAFGASFIPSGSYYHGVFLQLDTLLRNGFDAGESRPRGELFPAFWLETRSMIPISLCCIIGLDLVLKHVLEFLENKILNCLPCQLRQMQKEKRTADQRLISLEQQNHSLQNDQERLERSAATFIQAGHKFASEFGSGTLLLWSVFMVSVTGLCSSWRSSE